MLVVNGGGAIVSARIIGEYRPVIEPDAIIGKVLWDIVRHPCRIAEALETAMRIGLAQVIKIILNTDPPEPRVVRIVPQLDGERIHYASVCLFQYTRCGPCGGER